MLMNCDDDDMHSLLNIGMYSTVYSHENDVPTLRKNESIESCIVKTLIDKKSRFKTNFSIHRKNLTILQISF